MNIYITPSNEEKLREYCKARPQATMSGLINGLLFSHFDKLSNMETFPKGETKIPGGKVAVNDSKIIETVEAIGKELTSQDAEATIHADNVMDRIIRSPKRAKEISKAMAKGPCEHGAAKGFCRVQKCSNSKR